VRDTPLDVTVKYLEGIEWPANRAELVKAAERNGAPDDIVQTLRAIDHDHFAGPNAVHNALWIKA